MGWAKYYEDNVSIINNRHFEGVYVEKYPMRPVMVVDKRPTEIRRTSKNSRAGLQIHFFEKPSQAEERKLQINGWWHSNLNQCWCNYNTPVNRRFANSFAVQRKSLITEAA